MTIADPVGFVFYGTKLVIVFDAEVVSVFAEKFVDLDGCDILSKL